MGFSVGQLTADTDDEHRSVLLRNQVFALLDALIGIHRQQILTVYEMDLLRQEGIQLTIAFAHQELRTEDGGIDSTYNVLQEVEVTLVARNHSLPVPLVNIQ